MLYVYAKLASMIIKLRVQGSEYYQLNIIVNWYARKDIINNLL